MAEPSLAERRAAEPLTRPCPVRGTPAKGAFWALPLLLVPWPGSPSVQQAPPQLAASDYERAESRLQAHVADLVAGDVVSYRWLPDGRFAYSLTGEAGAAERRFLADPGSGVVTRAEEEPADGSRAEIGRELAVAPSGERAVFIRDHNLWLRDLASGAETQLTSDGVEDLGWATNNAGWIRSPRPVIKWSPDSKRVATFRHDSRGVGYMTLVSTRVGHPAVDRWRYPLPEDSVIFRIHRAVIDVEAPVDEGVLHLQMPPDQHRTTCSDHVVCGGEFGDVEWSADGRSLVFVSSSRDHKLAQVRRADTETGAVQDLFQEREDTFIHSIGWSYLSDSDEILWYSQRDGWGHLGLFDATTGEFKRQVTTGEWTVLTIESVDEERREVWFTAGGREAGDPYFRHLYRVGLDGGDPILLTPDSANHVTSIASGHEYFFDKYSTPIDPPVSVLRDRDGRVVMELGRGDVSSLIAMGWLPPEPFKVKARDGTTDLYGLMFRPSSFDPARRYPVVNYLYPGPQSGSVGSRSFRAAHRDLQAIAELGFVVIELDAMGTPGRSKEFHEFYYGNMGDNGIPDQIAGIRQLGARHGWIDLDRVGIYGHSGGGFAAAGAIFRHPDFYKVAVAQAGNHDNRNYEDDWGEKWQGLLEEFDGGSTNYDNQANQLVASNLQGKLLLAHGTLDTNVPHSSTMLVVDALIAANKDFDLLLLPNRGHGFGNEPYMMRRRWDYFVRHLLGAEPPDGYEIGRWERPVG